jgi:hypothetical protein
MAFVEHGGVPGGVPDREADAVERIDEIANGGAR